jgi:Ca2+:H+ antiporter
VFNAVRFSRKDQMDLALGITAGSSIQVALVVAPVLVFAGMLLGKSMDLQFSTFEIVAIVLAVMVARSVTSDGRSNWFEGLMLVAVYLILGMGFYYLPAPGTGTL